MTPYPPTVQIRGVVFDVAEYLGAIFLVAPTEAYYGTGDTPRDAFELAVYRARKGERSRVRSDE